MATLRFSKVVSSLPGILDPDTLYLVRTGAGFDLYVSDATGSIAYPVNAPAAPAQIAYPKRSATPKIVGDVNGTALTTLALTASRQYFIPLVVPRNVTLTGLRILVTTAATGTASIGIYGNTVVSGDDAPGTLLASVTGLDTGTTGGKTGTLNYTLQAGTLYWASMIASAAATIRALAVASRGAELGRTANNTTVTSYLYAAGSGSTLPTTAPTTLTAAAGAVTPAIYLLE
ncbi:MAG: hypothetical protein WHX53_13400 [Anaerolineae bacterium]